MSSATVKSAIAKFKELCISIIQDSDFSLFTVGVSTTKVVDSSEQPVQTF